MVIYIKDKYRILDEVFYELYMFGVSILSKNNIVLEKKRLNFIFELYINLFFNVRKLEKNYFKLLFRFKKKNLIIYMYFNRNVFFRFF